MVGVDITPASDGSSTLARSPGPTVLLKVPLAPTGIGFISFPILYMCDRTAVLGGSATQPECVEFFREPLDAVVAPERLALDDEGRHAEHPFTLGLFADLLELARPVAERVAFETVGLQPGFLHHRGQRGAVFDIQLAFEKALEHAVGVRPE